jgi:hypothetical protein
MMLADRYLAMLHAYCDESYTGDLKTTPVYVVAGFIGRAREWELFESLWRQTMKELRIEHIGCHASDCANGAGPYRGMRVDRRNEIQYRLIVDIVAAKLSGVAAVVDMNAYRAHKVELHSLVPKNRRQHYTPHVLAFGQCVDQMCEWTKKVTNDPLTFIVDQNAAGRAVKTAFDIARKNQAYPCRKRLATYTEADRIRVVGLQAADMLAYAAFRYANRNPGWQWRALRPAIPMNIMKSGEGYWSGQVRMLRAEQQRRLQAPGKGVDE